MRIATLTDLYLDQLRDMASADTQALGGTRRLSAAATSPALEEALAAGVAGIDRGRRTVEAILARHGARPEETICKGMEGLVAEADAHAIEQPIADTNVRDAMIIAQYQRMAHYAIAGYGCALALARRLGLEEDAADLSACLDGTKGGDRRLTGIAERAADTAAAAPGS